MKRHEPPSYPARQRCPGRYYPRHLASRPNPIYSGRRSRRCWLGARNAAATLWFQARSIARGCAAGAAECFSQARSGKSSPLSALNSALGEMTRYARTPEELANGLAFLEMDLTDPDFHRLARRSSKAILAGYRALLDDAIAAGELVACDTARLSHAVHALANGSMLEWAIHREGALADWLRRDVATLLAPLRVAKTGRRAAASRLSKRT
jgi:hypothetical protein